MKLKSVVLLGFALGLGRSALVAQPDPTQTYGFDNGRAWQSWSETFRLGYVDGYIEGTNAVVTIQKIDRADREHFVLPRLWPAGMRIVEIVHALDRFYDNPLNLRIAITSALSVVTLEAKGGSKDSADTYTRDLRSTAAGENK